MLACPPYIYFFFCPQVYMTWFECACSTYSNDLYTECNPRKYNSGLLIKDEGTGAARTSLYHNIWLISSEKGAALWVSRSWKASDGRWDTKGRSIPTIPLGHELVIAAKDLQKRGGGEGKRGIEESEEVEEGYCSILSPKTSVSGSRQGVALSTGRCSCNQCYNMSQSRMSYVTPSPLHAPLTYFPSFALSLLLSHLLLPLRLAPSRGRRGDCSCLGRISTGLTPFPSKWL